MSMTLVSEYSCEQHLQGTYDWERTLTNTLSLGYVVSAIFICAEYQRLGIHYRQYQVLRMSFWVKLAFIFIEVALVIGFGVCSKYRAYNAAAILEWIVSLIYIFYVW